MGLETDPVCARSWPWWGSHTMESTRRAPDHTLGCPRYRPRRAMDFAHRPEHPSAQIRSIVAVRTSPPNVVGRPGPASSINTITIFGESPCSREGVTRCAYVDSCRVRPATLADGVGGNGSVAPPGSFGATTPLGVSASMFVAAPDMAAPFSKLHLPCASHATLAKASPNLLRTSGAASLSHKASVNQAAMPSRPRVNVDAVLGHVVE